MSEKVIVPREVAEALDVLLYEAGYFPIDVAWALGKFLVNEDVHDGELYERTGDIFAAIREGKTDPQEVLTALVNGYEPEPTPEEIVRGAYERAKSDTESGDYERIYKGEAVMEAIEMFADAYNIKIPGVNAPNEEELD